jgi:hypothetical protein
VRFLFFFSRRQRATKDEILDAAVERVKALEDTAAVLEAYRGAPPQRGGRRRPGGVPLRAAAGAGARRAQASVGGVRPPRGAGPGGDAGAPRRPRRGGRRRGHGHRGRRSAGGAGDDQGGHRLHPLIQACFPSASFWFASNGTCYSLPF